MKKLTLSLLATAVMVLSGCATQTSVSPTPEEVSAQQKLLQKAESQGKNGDSAGQLASLNQAEQIGSAEAANHLGTIYSQGGFLPVDKKEAFKHFNRAAQLGSPDAQITTALLNLYGIGTDKDETAGLDLLKHAAITDKRAQRELGLMYGSLRLPFLHDDKKGLKYLSEAAEKGDADASYYLSVLAERNHDDALVKKALEKAANLGQPKAQLSLGRQEVKAGQYMLARDNFLKSARSNDSEAMFELAKGLNAGFFPITSQVKGVTPVIETYIWLEGANFQKHLQARDLLKEVEPKLPTDQASLTIIDEAMKDIQASIKPYNGNK